LTCNGEKQITTTTIGLVKRVKWETLGGKSDYSWKGKKV